MFMQPARPAMRRLMAATILTILAGTLISALAYARVAMNTIDPTARLTDNGRGIVVTGPIQCSEGQPVDLQVTVSQRSTGAVAEGTARITCTPELGQWELRVTTQGNAAFQEGEAIATALARSTQQGNPDDAHQWLVAITLVRE